ncbi:hypothetical protein B0H12DRAFT_1102373 [Mycena haematopus]|nr:hypothetical protein B0H12DRAFT_1102373 [Mycena haematopus]
MHMGMKSLELLLPGGVEKLEERLERIATGIRIGDEEEDELQADESFASDSDESSSSDSKAERLKLAVGDPWLFIACPTLNYDLNFTLWGSFPGDDEVDVAPLMKAIRSRPAKVLTGPT